MLQNPESLLRIQVVIQLQEHIRTLTLQQQLWLQLFPKNIE